jgi:hypothetical protein
MTNSTTHTQIKVWDFGVLALVVEANGIFFFSKERRRTAHPYIKVEGK